jgi:hypothetical protein
MVSCFDTFFSRLATLLHALAMLWARLPTSDLRSVRSSMFSDVALASGKEIDEVAACRVTTLSAVGAAFSLCARIFDSWCLRASSMGAATLLSVRSSLACVSGATDR